MDCHGHQQESVEGCYYHQCVVARLGHISRLGLSRQENTTLRCIALKENYKNPPQLSRSLPYIWWIIPNIFRVADDQQQVILLTNRNIRWPSHTPLGRGKTSQFHPDSVFKITFSLEETNWGRADKKGSEKYWIKGDRGTGGEQKGWGGDTENLHIGELPRVRHELTRACTCWVVIAGAYWERWPQFRSVPGPPAAARAFCGRF